MDTKTTPGILAAMEQKPTGSAFAQSVKKIHPKLRPWHLLAAFALLAVIAIVLSTVLVHLRDQRRETAPFQIAVNVRSFFFVF